MQAERGIMFSKPKRISFRIISILAIVALVVSCAKETAITTKFDLDRSYFPLETGYWIEYTADSIFHSNIDDVYLLDTSIKVYNFQVKEVVDTPFIDATGDTAFVIQRYRRDNDTLPWTFTSLWTEKKNSASAERVEENIRFVKLDFPFSFYKKWDGNAYNTFGEEDYSYEDIYSPKTYNALRFDSSVTVLQNDFISSINRIEKREVYAPRVGMIFKQLDSLNTVITPNGVVILNGVEYNLTVKDYKR